MTTKYYIHKDRDILVRISHDLVETMDIDSGYFSKEGKVGVWEVSLSLWWSDKVKLFYTEISEQEVVLLI